MGFAQSQDQDLGAQDPLGGAVYGGFGNLAFLHGAGDVGHVVFADEFHVHAGVQAGDGGFVIIPNKPVAAVAAAGAEFRDVAHVRGDKAVEAPFLAQQGVQQPGVRMAGHAVERVVGWHDRTGAGGFNGSFERRHVDFPEVALGGFEAFAIRAGPGFAIGEHVLGSGDDIFPAEPRVAFSLGPLDVGDGHA